MRVPAASADNRAIGTDIAAKSRDWREDVTDTDLIHATLVFERHVAGESQAVFEAYADVEKRMEWGAPSDTAAIIYDEADFRIGGIDRFRCGSKLNPNIHGTTAYLDIVPNFRIVSSEVIEMDGTRLSASLTTAEFISASDGGTDLRSTTQLVSFAGEDMVRGTDIGNNGSLNSLVRYFAQPRR